MWFSGQAYSSWIPVRSNIQQMEIWLVNLFLSWKKFHAKQIFELSSSMKLGPEMLLLYVSSCAIGYKPYKQTNKQTNRRTNQPSKAKYTCWPSEFLRAYRFFVSMFVSASNSSICWCISTWSIWVRYSNPRGTPWIPCGMGIHCWPLGPVEPGCLTWT